MKKSLPAFTGAVVALSACNSSAVNLFDRVTDNDLVSFCKQSADCDGKILHKLDVFYCVDEIQDEMHRAKKFGCDADYEDLVACQIKESIERVCPSDFETYEDYQDDLADYQEDVADNADACDSEIEDYNDCINDFLGLESGFYY